MRTILFFIPKLVGAGAERTLLNIVNHIDRNCFNPLLVLHSATGPYLDMLKGDVKIINLGSTKKLPTSIIPLAIKIRSLKPDLVFSTTWHPNIVLAISTKLSVSRIPLVLRESNNLTAAGEKNGTLRNKVLAWAYRNANKVIALSEGVKQDVINRYDLESDKITTIYNPIDIKNIEELAKKEPGDWPWENVNQNSIFRIIAVGRLIKQKGFDILIQALSELRNIPWRLIILGDGIERKRLLALTSKLKVGDRVILPGFRKNPYAWVSRADLFVLSSRWEGFGHVIVEAMVCGTPVLATQCPSGPDEIINNNVNGLLCEPDSVEDMSSKIKWLYENPDTRRRYVNEAKRSANRFDVKTIVRQYEKLFIGLIGEKA